MTTPTILPTGYKGDYRDYLNAPGVDKSGAVRSVRGSVVIPDETAVGAFVGLVPFQKGASFILNDKSIHITDIDSGTDSTVNVGIVYEDNTTYTNDPDAFASASTAGQAGGFVSIDETSGMTLVTKGNGWLVLENEANITEAEGTVTFNVCVAYD